MIITLIIGSTIPILFGILYYLYRYFTYWSRNGIKGPNVFEGIKTWAKILQNHDYEMSQKYGKIYGFYELFSRGIMINDPELMKDILVKDFQKFPNRRYYTLGPILDHSLMMSRDGQWKKLRSILSPTFSSSKSKAMLSAMSGLTDDFCKNIADSAKSGEPIDIKKNINALMVDVISSCAFGIKTDVLREPNHPMAHYGKIFFSQNLQWTTMIGFLAPAVGKFFNICAADPTSAKYFRDLTRNIAKDRVTKNGTNKIPVDFIQLMLNANQFTSKSTQFSTMNAKSHDSDEEFNKGLTEMELTAQNVQFFLVGHDSTSSVLYHCCHYIAKYPQIQEKLYEEVSQLENFEFESLQKLEYLNAFIKEVLRMVPAINRFDREAAEDYKLGDTGIVIPKGTLVTFSPYCVHHDENNFKDSFEFRPERFLPNSDEEPYHPFAYIPFGGGPRICVAMKLAKHQLRICVAKLVKNISLSLPENEELHYFTGTLACVPKNVMAYACVRS